MYALGASVLQADGIADAQLLMLVNVLLVLAIVGFSAGIAVVLVRRSMRQRLEAERLAAMGTATARILHQLKNPLQTLVLHAELLEENEVVADPARRREVGDTIIGEATRMSELLSELSAYASGVRRQMRADPVALDDVVTAAVQGEIREAERCGIQVLVEPRNEVMIAGDSYFLRQAVENVLRNAREALSDMEGEKPRQLRVAVRRHRTEAIVEIRDNGAGIAPDQLGQVFEPFITTKGHGMGLGLPIAREIVEGHGGRIEVRSWPGGGTTVTMAFPLAADSAPAAPRPKPAGAPAHRDVVSSA